MKGYDPMSLNEAPRASRLHIGIFGRTNSGKSSLVNALTGQQAALVSEQEGTTTDPVYKAMEIHGLGPCVFIDTAGFDDTGALGKLRVDATREALKKNRYCSACSDAGAGRNRTALAKSDQRPAHSCPYCT